jgi:hypothetical protein
VGRFVVFYRRADKTKKGGAFQSVMGKMRFRVRLTVEKKKCECGPVTLVKAPRVFLVGPRALKGKNGPDARSWV